VVRVDQIFCLDRNIFQNNNFGMFTSFNLTFIQQQDQMKIQLAPQEIKWGCLLDGHCVRIPHPTFMEQQRILKTSDNGQEL